MPCNCDYLEPSHFEKEMKRAAVLLVYLLKKLNRKPEQWMLSCAENYYGRDDKQNHREQVETLCSVIRSLTGTQIEKIVYNAHDKNARDLASWWEEHQAADRKRVAEERRKKQLAEAKKSGLAKLTKTEREALDVD